MAAKKIIDNLASLHYDFCGTTSDDVENSDYIDSKDYILCS